jgi:hypothetical protein
MLLVIVGQRMRLPKLAAQLDTRHGAEPARNRRPPVVRGGRPFAGQGLSALPLGHSTRASASVRHPHQRRCPHLRPCAPTCTGAVHRLTVPTMTHALSVSPKSSPNAAG